MVVLFHAATVLVVLVTTSAHQYYRQTGTTLDYDVVALFLPAPDQVLPMLGGVPVLAWVLLAIALSYVVFGPFLLTRAVERRRGRSGTSTNVTSVASSLLGPLGLFLLALGFGSFSVLIDPAPPVGGKSFARDPLVNLAVTGMEDSGAEEDVGLPVENPAANASLAETGETERRNVVLIHLESTRAGATTPYNQNLETTPFLNELAKDSLVAERAYATLPHSSKASVSANCGVYPRPVPQTSEALPDGIPAPCLAGLLKDQGYDTALFQSSTKRFENFQGLVNNFGCEEYYPLEAMDEEGFEKTNYFGYEDDIMLEPSEEWLEEHGDGPFVAEYLTGSGHHDYQCTDTRHGTEDFAGDELLNSYLNCMRLQDVFVESLIEQYKELGLYENTSFVIYGDHGEGFGEHGRSGHNDTIWEEGIKIPLLIHAPGYFGGGERIEGLSNQTDVLPTVLDMLGYEVENGEYPGYSLLQPIPEDRALMFSCFFEDTCLASITGTEKYVHHFGNRPDEVFDLARDPGEEHNLADERPGEEVDERRDELLA